MVFSHWQKMCCKTKTKQRNGRSSCAKRRGSLTRDRPRRKQRITSHHSLDHRTERESSISSVNASYDGERQYQQQFYAIPVSSKCLDIIAYSILGMQPAGHAGDGYTLCLKIYTGAEGNTLPLRTIRQMCGRNFNIASLLQSEHNTRLTAYNGKGIRCLGSSTIPCRFKSTSEMCKFHVIDVNCPAVVGLPTCEKLNLGTINVENINQKSGKKSLQQELKLQHLTP